MIWMLFFSDKHTLHYLMLPYLTLPFTACVLPPSAEASSGPNMHPRINSKVRETFYRFLQTWEECFSVLILGHQVLRNTFQRIHIVSQRLHSSCLRDASWCLPLLYRVDTEDHPFYLTRWDVGSKCCARSEDRLIILSPSWTIVQHTMWVVCWLLAQIAWLDDSSVLRHRLFCFCTNHWQISYLIFIRDNPRAGSGPT